MHARIYDFTLGANGMQRLAVVGDFFKVITAIGTINVNVDTGAVLDVMPGQGLREFPFNTLTITDKSGTANSGKILVGFSGMVDDRVTGEVSVIEGGAVRSRSNSAFGASHQRSAVVGQYSFVQLWNPAGSTKRVIVSELAFDVSVAGQVLVRAHTAPIAAFILNGAPKLIGGAVSTAEVRGEDNVGLLGNPIYGMAVGTTGVIHRLSEPFVLNPGTGISISSAPNVTTRGNFQFYEELV